MTLVKTGRMVPSLPGRRCPGARAERSASTRRRAGHGAAEPLNERLETLEPRRSPVESIRAPAARSSRRGLEPAGTRSPVQQIVGTRVGGQGRKVSAVWFVPQNLQPMLLVGGAGDRSADRPAHFSHQCRLAHLSQAKLVAGWIADSRSRCRTAAPRGGSLKLTSARRELLVRCLGIVGRQQHVPGPALRHGGFNLVGCGGIQHRRAGESHSTTRRPRGWPGGRPSASGSCPAPAASHRRGAPSRSFAAVQGERLFLVVHPHSCEPDLYHDSLFLTINRSRCYGRVAPSSSRNVRRRGCRAPSTRRPGSTRTATPAGMSRRYAVGAIP